MATYPFSPSDMRYPIKDYIDQAIAEAIAAIVPGGGGAPEVMFVLNGVSSYGYGFTGYSSGGAGTIVTLQLTTPRALGTYVAVVSPLTFGVDEVTAAIGDLDASQKEIHLFVNHVPTSTPFMFALWPIVPP